ncbi:MAG: alpha/beta fold hydrolase [Rhodothermales bacterium]|nr:alpha/beta fold hydrolase [Rhodothermales bacterium]
MKRFIFLLIGFVSALVIILGPRPVIDDTIRPLTLPADLDTYLADAESRFPDLIPGAEKTIVWATPEKTRTPVSIVYLHGFSATRQETRPLSDSIAAALGANLFYTRLAGHGRSDDAMGEASINDWLNDAMEAYAIGRRLGERVVVIGTSTGGTLATWLAARSDVDELLALVLISPNFGPKDPTSRLLLWPWGTQLARLVVGPYYTWEPANFGHARFWKTRHPSRALVPMMGLVDLVNGLDFAGIASPLLVVYSPNDQVVNPALIAEAYPRFGSPIKEAVVLDEVGDPSNHVLAGDILSPDETMPMVRRVVAFLRPLLTDSPLN